MLKISYYVVLEVHEDVDGFLSPVFFDLDKLKEHYPDSKYIEVNVDNTPINLN